MYKAYILDENWRRHLYRFHGLFLCNISYFSLSCFTNSSCPNSLFLSSLSSDLSQTKLRLFELCWGEGGGLSHCAAICKCLGEGFMILGPPGLSSFSLVLESCTASFPTAKVVISYIFFSYIIVFAKGWSITRYSIMARGRIL